MNYDRLLSTLVGCVIGASVITAAWASSEKKSTEVCHATKTVIAATMPSKEPAAPTITKPADHSMFQIARDKSPSPLFHVEFVPTKTAAWVNPVPKKYYAEAHRNHHKYSHVTGKYHATARAGPATPPQTCGFLRYGCGP